MKEISYTEYKHSYAHALQPKMKKINYLANGLHKPAGYIYKVVLGIINESPDVKATDKELEFLLDCKNNCATGTAVYYRCKNAINYANNFMVKVDDEGELIKEN